MRRSSAGHATIALARCALSLERGWFSNSHRPSSEGTFRIDTPARTSIRTVDCGLASLALHLGPLAVPGLKCAVQALVLEGINLRILRVEPLLQRGILGRRGVGLVQL